MAKVTITTHRTSFKSYRVYQDFRLYPNERKLIRDMLVRLTVIACVVIALTGAVTLTALTFI